jgi:glutaredoxin/glutathione-dependent peroxiredoxin
LRAAAATAAMTCRETLDEEAPMTIQVGDKLPAANLKQLTADGIKDVSVGDLTRGKKVVLFAVPGAFTPTCSERHLPGFVEQAEALKAKGVDTIACVAVNDPFVLGAWEKARNVGGKVTMLSDGNGDFTRALGLEFDGSGFGLGKRSRRYAMVVEDGTVKTLLVEEVPSQAERSSASAILATL